MTTCKHEEQSDECYGRICLVCGIVLEIYDDDWPNEESYDDEEWFDCGWVRGMGCTMAGSEECDWECPHRRDFEKGLRLTQARLAKRAKKLTSTPSE